MFIRILEIVGYSIFTNCSPSQSYIEIVDTVDGESLSDLSLLQLFLDGPCQGISRLYLQF